jgi:hypothetical protein
MNTESRPLKLLPITLSPPRADQPEWVGVIDIAVKVHWCSGLDGQTSTLSASSATVIDLTSWETEIVYQACRLLVDQHNLDRRDIIDTVEHIAKELKKPA